MRAGGDLRAQSQILHTDTGSAAALHSQARVARGVKQAHFMGKTAPSAAPGDPPRDSAAIAPSPATLPAEPLTPEQIESMELGELMAAEHVHLHQLFKRVGEAFCRGARDEAARLWDEFDTGLDHHLALEEELIFPRCAEHHGREVAMLLADHAQLREQLVELGVGVDLHLTRAAAVLKFIHTLEDHARREDAMLYRWAERHLSPEVQSNIRTRIAHFMHQRSKARAH